MKQNPKVYQQIKLKMKFHMMIIWNVWMKNEPMKTDVVNIVTKKHQLQTITNPKISMSPWYDEMYMINAIDCQPYGYKVQKLEI